jgi:hypothetical protein
LLDSVAAPESIEVDNVVATIIAPVCNVDETGSFMQDTAPTFVVMSTPIRDSDTRGAITCADVTGIPDQIPWRTGREHQRADIRV